LRWHGAALASLWIMMVWWVATYWGAYIGGSSNGKNVFAADGVLAGTIVFESLTIIAFVLLGLDLLLVLEVQPLVLRYAALIVLGIGLRAWTVMTVDAATSTDHPLSLCVQPALMLAMIPISRALSARVAARELPGATIEQDQRAHGFASWVVVGCIVAISMSGGLAIVEGEWDPHQDAWSVVRGSLVGCAMGLIAGCGLAMLPGANGRDPARRGRGTSFVVGLAACVFVDVVVQIGVTRLTWQGHAPHLDAPQFAPFGLWHLLATAAPIALFMGAKVLRASVTTYMMMAVLFVTALLWIFSTQQGHVAPLGHGFLVGALLRPLPLLAAYGLARGMIRFTMESWFRAVLCGTLIVLSWAVATGFGAAHLMR
jgi:hypothetical protein